ncbi:hypothetical protein BKA62DRAFT_14572 [Auriculariales sp. MPI-PUGE-AT-0066]|nr:hypothetical protein BKA62DRAFT_14572 [Auriculariales sp. MPI-PUGE-AT-0066]
MEVLPSQDGLAQWRYEQAHFVEQQEVEELRRKLEAKKQHTHRWVIDQQRWEDSRPPNEQRTRLDGLRGSPLARPSTPQAFRSSLPRLQVPPQRARAPAFGERPQHARRATDLGAYDVARPATPSTCPYRAGMKRSATIPASAERTAGPYSVSPQIEEIRLQAEQWMHEWLVKDEQMRTRAEAEAAKTRALQDSINIAMRRMEDVLGPSTPQMTNDELERRRQLAAAQEQRKKLHEQRVSRAFATYRNRWAVLQANPPQNLTFQDIPWPTLVAPESPPH